MRRRSVFFMFFILAAYFTVPFDVSSQSVNGRDLAMWDSEISVSVHCKARVLIWDSDLSGAVEGVTWSSADESIAVVDAEGFVTGKRVGKTVVTGIYEGASFTCDVAVTPNRVRYKKYSKKPSKYKKNEMIFRFSEASIDADGTLTLKGDFINTYGRKIKYAKNVKFSLYHYGKRFKKQKIGKISLNVKAGKSKEITLKFKNIDPKIDLNMGNLSIYYSGGKIK